jgi:acetyltransferase
VNEVDILNYFAEDALTEVIALHLEDVKDGRKFLEAARRAIARKPVLILKPGKSEQAARASASHTSSLTGSDYIYESAFKQVGVIRVNTWQEFWEIPKVFVCQPLPRGNRVAIITHSGGAGVVAADMAIEAGLEIATFTANTTDKLRRRHPGLASNPVDLGPASSLSADPLALEDELINTVLNDTNVDCAAIALYGGSMTPMAFILEMFDRLMHSVAKPVAIWIYGTKSNMMAELSHKLESIGLPTYSELDTAVKALGAAAYYSKIISGLDHR